MEFKEWIWQKYREWRNEVADRKSSEAEFARFLGLKQQVLNDWMNGNTKPRSQQTIGKLAEKYGLEIYEILNLPLPNSLPTDFSELPFDEQTRAKYAMLSDEAKKRIQRQNQHHHRNTIHCQIRNFVHFDLPRN